MEQKQAHKLCLTDACGLLMYIIKPKRVYQVRKCGCIDNTVLKNK